MHELLREVLDRRQLCKAGELFQISYYDVIADLHTALAKLKAIFNDPDYATDTKSQSVLEICLSCITNAVRETRSIETYAPGLVDMLEDCLNHNLTAPAIMGQGEETPHSKIASDLLSSLFLHYGKKSVMTVAIPVAVRALESGNKDLIRNTSSYLSLAAIHNGRLLAQYALQIINSITSGNYALVRVLPQVYPENKEPFHAHLPALLATLKHPECDPSEKLSILQLASMVANTTPDLIIPHLNEFQSSLMSANTCTAVLHIYLSLMTMGRTAALSDQLDALRHASQAKITANNLSTIAKISAALARLNRTYASVVTKDLLDMCRKADLGTLPILLQEIEGVAEAWPQAVRPYLSEVQRLAEGNTSTLSAWVRIRDLCSEDQKIRQRLMQPSSNEEITVISVLNGSDGGRSQESLASKRSSRPSIATIPEINTSQSAVTTSAGGPATGTSFTIVSNGNERSAPNSAQELDANTQSLAKSYKMRSNSSLSKQKSRSYGNLMNYNNSKRSSSESGATRISPVAITPGCPGRKAFRQPGGYMTPVSGRPRHPMIPPPPTYQPPSNTKSAAVASFSVNQLPFVSPTGITSSPQFQLGPNGRVRPVPSRRPHNPPPWLPTPPTSSASAANQNNAKLQNFSWTPPDPRHKSVNNGNTNGNNGNKVLCQETTFPANPGGPTTMMRLAQPNDTNKDPVLVKITGHPLDDPIRGGVGDRDRSRSLNAAKTPPHKQDAQTQLNSFTGSDTLVNRNASNFRSREDWTSQTERGDVVFKFCENRKGKIVRYVTELSRSYPVPLQCTIEGTKGNKQRMRVHFGCQIRDAHCLYSQECLFAFKTRFGPIWLHLMFLQMQANSLETGGRSLTQTSDAFQTLRHCWECLPPSITRNRPFATHVTSAFPAHKDQQSLFKELELARYFDSFTYMSSNGKWACFACNHPDRVKTFMRQDTTNPVLEGQLKEKRGRWKFLKRWHTKYFTLSTAALSCRQDAHTETTENCVTPSIDLRKIRSVKSLSKGKKSRKSLPKAFEIFTDDDNSYVLKAHDRTKAEEWFQCLQIAVAQAQRERQTTQL